MPDGADIGSIAPSGTAWLFLMPTPAPPEEGIVDVTWCLGRDVGEPTCLTSGTQQLRCLGGSPPVGWRPDEQAVVLCGERQTKGTLGSSFDGWDSVLDFSAGRVVQLDPSTQPMVAPFWTRDGKRVLAFPPGKRPHRPWWDDTKTPLTVDPWATPITARPASRDAAKLGPIWATRGHGLEGVILMEPPRMKRRHLTVTQATQDVVDVTPDRRFALVEDDDVAHGRDGTLWRVLDLRTKSVRPIQNPPGFRGGTHAELSDDGSTVLAIWSTGQQVHLGITPNHGDTWQEVYRWEPRDPDRPHRFVSDGEMQWDGGPIATIISDSDAILQVRLAP